MIKENLRPFVGLRSTQRKFATDLSNLAISYNINIITGSMPYVKEDGLLYNVGSFVVGDGTYEMYEKCMHSG